VIANPLGTFTPWDVSSLIHLPKRGIFTTDQGDIVNRQVFEELNVLVGHVYILIVLMMSASLRAVCFIAQHAIKQDKTQ
jgi:hypothetical protein